MVLISRKCLPLSSYYLINVVGVYATQKLIYRALCVDFSNCHCGDTVKVEVNYLFRKIHSTRFNLGSYQHYLVVLEKLPFTFRFLRRTVFIF